MKRSKDQRPRDTWVPLALTSNPPHEDERFIKVAMDTWGVDRDEAVRRLDDWDAACEYWMNDLYQVTRRVVEGAGGIVHLNIRRRDGAVVRDWRHLQRIKNELIGAECEAIEIFPAESRLVDTCNKYHLWGYTDPTFRFPVAIDKGGRRDVVTEEVSSPPGMRQRAMGESR